MDQVTLPPGWEHHAAPAATLFDPLGPSIAWWATGAILSLAAFVLLTARPRLSLALALLSALALAIAANGLVDDAYIQFRYAANLAAGRGPVFNPGERLEGASGGIWIGAVALASALTRVDAALCGRVLSLVAAVCSVVAAAAFGRACGGRRGAALAAIAWGSIPTAALYAATGLETSAYTLALWSVAASVVRDRRGPAAAAGALVATLRPEGVVLALGAALFFRRLGRAGRAAVVGCLAGALVIACARLAWYGAPVPRPALVKGIVAPAGVAAGLRYLGQAATEWWPLVPALLWMAPRRRALLPILVPVALLTCLVVTRGGDWMPGGRYLVPLVVLLVAMATATVAGRVGDGRPTGPARLAALWLAPGPLAWGLLLLMPHPGPLEGLPRIPIGGAWRAMAEHRVQSRWWEALGSWLRENAPPGTHLASGPSGALPYASRLPTFDIYGLCSLVTNRGGTEAGHGLWGLREAVASGADIIYPGRELLLVESPGRALPAAERRIADETDPLAGYRPVTITHVPEYRLDFLRDVIWVRRWKSGPALTRLSKNGEDSPGRGR
ncbi:MAG TPA: hypothetical protein VEW47_05445 [Candidatus Dormibacteraeota bacterium]|nr:hypothetical protein [Candidatus Dormibacteraeota bacterium]